MNLLLCSETLKLGQIPLVFFVNNPRNVLCFNLGAGYYSKIREALSKEEILQLQYSTLSVELRELCNKHVQLYHCVSMAFHY